ncbi:nucleotide exchange factor GrpE [Ornithinibacillus gellani]|uniref:nucleotide exchange factor GrpE n=1 Tax=Ornithinibacillus gellani TaxID=2293253 RepID=UPI000F47B22F|nr:nucleotide exchange factor GrpE [Ornithinibacillus gellani]TQS74590.1 nucleotide exchange factor GrpE [Ornithinibacillus gellani]
MNQKHKEQPANENEEETILNEETEPTVDEPSEEVEVEETLEDVNVLAERLAKLEQEKQEVFDRYVRLQAEFDNFKKRTQKEKEADRKYKSQDLIQEILPALDNFERALQVELTEENASYAEGMSMVHRQLIDALKSEGVEEIETVGKPFDPNVHHAVMQVEEADVESNHIVEAFQKGYMLKDRVIRPAMVKVNK